MESNENVIFMIEGQVNQLRGPLRYLNCFGPPAITKQNK